MSITFRRLQVFVTAAQEGNFRRTADLLGISQPSVSAQIRAIEQHLGYALFERRRGASSALTREGRELLAQALELVEAQRNLAAERQSARRAQAAVLRVSVGPILLEARVKPMLAEFYERHPDIALEFVPFDPSSDGGKAIRSGALDVILFTGGPPERRFVKMEIIASVGCSIYGSPDFLRRLSSLEAAELSDLPFVIPPRDYRITQWFEAKLAGRGVRLRNIVAQPPYLDVVLQMLLAGKGLGVLFDDLAAEHVKQGRLRAVGDLSLPAFRVMMMGRRALRAEAAPALRFLRAVAAGREGLLHGKKSPAALFRTVASLPVAKGVTFAT